VSAKRLPNVINASAVNETVTDDFPGWRSFRKPMSPAMPKGRLGARITRVPSGQSACPFHTHQVDDEIFFVLSGQGILRYGERLTEISAGDCISCPAATGVAHQIANPFAEDLVYLAIGTNDPREVCTYPDHGTMSVRGLGLSGRIEPIHFTSADVSPPKIFSLLSGANIRGSEPS
jgi:uncharacterized cupin superfamily protein